jgi:DNA primase
MDGHSKKFRAPRLSLMCYRHIIRNDETASAVAAYGVRAHPGAPVSASID